MEFQHTSVLLTETIKHLAIKADGIYVDGTLGGGGHAAAICEQLGPRGTLIGIDRDQDALNAAQEHLKEYPCRKLFLHDNYSNIKNCLDKLSIPAIDGAVLDLGVSSFQLDNEARGFSYMKDAPLDMRMNAEDDLTAEKVVNTYSQEELTQLIRRYGEERWASRISEFIVKRRREQPFSTTAELVETIKAAIPASARREGPHPAKRTFQAIRIEVNDELGQLELAVEEFLQVLADKGRLCIITFHSLEDRIVKEIFQKHLDPCICPKEFPLCSCGRKTDVRKITGKPIVASDLELKQNPRARSAKLRVIEKRK